MLFALLACAVEEPEDTAAEREAYCADAPEVTFTSFGAGFLIERCQGCHRAEALEETGAPFPLETTEDVWSHDRLILAEVTSGSMPPAGAPDEEVELVRAWLTCAEPGT